MFLSCSTWNELPRFIVDVLECRNLTTNSDKVRGTTISSKSPRDQTEKITFWKSQVRDVVREICPFERLGGWLVDRMVALGFDEMVFMGGSLPERTILYFLQLVSIEWRQIN